MVNQMFMHLFPGNMFIAVLAWYSGATTQRRFDPALLLLDGRHVLDLSVNLGWDELKQLLVDDAEVTNVEFLLVGDVDLLC